VDLGKSWDDLGLKKARERWRDKEGEREREREREREDRKSVV